MLLAEAKRYLSQKQGDIAHKVKEILLTIAEILVAEAKRVIGC